MGKSKRARTGGRENEDETRVREREREKEWNKGVELKRELICEDTHKGLCEPPCV